jgi:hypothetical protein
LSDSFAGRPRLDSRTVAVIAIATVIGAAYLRWTPLAPDLAAQVARADVTRQVGNSSWWTGWFGGVSMPSYSVIVPTSMAALGVQVTGLLATIVGTLGCSRLLRAAVRPRAGAIAFALSGAADLIDGRVTFVVGAAIGVWSLIALRSKRVVLAATLAVGAYFASPLAALFLGLIFVAVALAQSELRRVAGTVALMVVALAASMAALFPGTGTMPFDFRSAIVPALCCLGIIVICRHRLIRTTAWLAIGATVVFVLVPGAVGSNITRLAWISAAPTAVAYARLSRRWLIAAVGLLAAWPLTDTVGQLHSGAAPSARAAYYAPLAAALDAQRTAAGPAAIGERVEVVDTRNHWASVYLATQSLARGWDRQADDADNPIFYRPGALTAASYRMWLDSLAVGWVALPAAQLDFASVDEGRLVGSGLPYLRLAYSSTNWRLYRVDNAAPLAEGATVDAVDADAVTVTTSSAVTVHLRLRWSPYLAAIDPATRQSVPSCALDEDGWLALYLPRGETVAVTSDFSVAARLRTADPDCVQDVSSPPGSSS